MTKDKLAQEARDLQAKHGGSYLDVLEELLGREDRGALECVGEKACARRTQSAFFVRELIDAEKLRMEQRYGIGPRSDRSHDATDYSAQDEAQTLYVCAYGAGTSGGDPFTVSHASGPFPLTVAMAEHERYAQAGWRVVMSADVPRSVDEPTSPSREAERVADDVPDNPADEPAGFVFSMSVQMGNAGIVTRSDLVAALRLTADRMADEKDVAGTVRDLNGNTVGNWSVGYPEGA